MTIEAAHRAIKEFLDSEAERLDSDGREGRGRLYSMSIWNGTGPVTEETERQISECADKAMNGDPDAWGACEDLICMLSLAGQPLPMSLMMLACRTMQGEFARPRDGKDYARRERPWKQVVYQAVKLGIAHGLPAYANGNCVSGGTACEVVAEEVGATWTKVRDVYIQGLREQSPGSDPDRIHVIGP